LIGERGWTQTGASPTFCGSGGIMKFTDYIGIDMLEFQNKYLDTGLV
jgi:hypothetical protein